MRPDLVRALSLALTLFALSFAVTYTLVAYSSGSNLGVASVFDWMYKYIYSKGYIKHVSESFSATYVASLEGGDTLLDGDSFTISYYLSLRVKRQVERLYLKVEVRPKNYGGSPQVVGIYTNDGRWITKKYDGITSDGHVYAVFNITNPSLVITRVALGHSSGGWSDPTHVKITVIKEDVEAGNETVVKTCEGNANSHVWECSNCHSSNYFEYVPFNCDLSGLSVRKKIIYSGNYTVSAPKVEKTSASLRVNGEYVVVKPTPIGGSGATIASSPKEAGMKLSWVGVQFTDLNGRSAKPTHGKQVLVHVKLDSDKPGVYARALVVVMIYRYDPASGSVVVDSNSAVGVFSTIIGHDVEVSLLWWPKTPGTYLIRAYVWNGLPGSVSSWESYAPAFEERVTVS